AAKTHPDENAPVREPMRPAGIRSKPSTDQKRVRRGMNKGLKPKTAVEDIDAVEDEDIFGQGTPDSAASAASPAEPEEEDVDDAKEAALLRAMAGATLAEQSTLATELAQVRARRVARVRESYEIDLS